MSNQIVVVSTNVLEAPAPTTLQQSGAMISQGGTNLDPGTLQLLTGPTSLQSYTPAPLAISALTWLAAVATAVTAAAHGYTIGDVVPIVVAGAVPAGYNGTFQGTVVDTVTITYPLATNPGLSPASTPGTINLGAVGELAAMNATFWAQQGVFQAVYVLELGEGTVDEGVAALATWIGNNLNTIYSYAVPREWDNNSDFLAFLAGFGAVNSFTYFFVTTTIANRAVYAGLKQVLAIVEAPVIPPTEFSISAEWAVTLNYSPNSNNQTPPLSYAFIYGVTPYPLPGNQTIFAELKTANVGWVGTGAEGNLSDKIVFRGKLSDGNPFNFWYSTDWAQLNLDISLANEIIIGSNSQPPLYYNQQGIDRLQNRAAQTLGVAISNGLANGQLVTTKLPVGVFYANFLAGLYEGQIVINAEPFLIYSAENPGDYAIGKYAGLAAVYTPLRGFDQVFFTLNVTNIIA